ncbi:hypothetical protein SDC9_156780 [bioreactor metagenome]|uniref:Uncharacterized protein n=1 Tax=bioreactor metagenome TaxID=1076179 RepID=A0A645F6I6_9ZZZZ
MLLKKQAAHLVMGEFPHDPDGIGGKAFHRDTSVMIPRVRPTQRLDDAKPCVFLGIEA